MIFGNRFLLTNQGKLLTKHNIRYVYVLLRAYLGLSLKPMGQNNQILQYLIIVKCFV
jgi:hypothetical protein